MLTRRSEEVLTLTSVTVETILAEDALTTTQSTALYIVWLLSQRQRCADRLLAALSCLDARGRLATMLLDHYTRLWRRKLITAPEYNLPLTQIQIGSYLGLTAVHVNRTLRLWRDERIVQMEKHCVTILDLEGLTNMAHTVQLRTRESARYAKRLISTPASFICASAASSGPHPERR
jgi:CRP-like cAMP-binding protein